MSERKRQYLEALKANGRLVDRSRDDPLGAFV